MPTRPRPDELGWWFKHGRRLVKKNIPTIGSIDKFQADWVAWWSVTQPQWRQTSSWPFEQGDAAGRDWGTLLNGGKDGLFLVVVSLGWWINARDPAVDSRVDDAVADVTWVLDNLVSTLSAAAITGA